jgi:hypothetical protein
MQPELTSKLHMFQANKAQNVNEKFSIFDQFNNNNAAIATNMVDRSFSKYNSDFGY